MRVIYSVDIELECGSESQGLIELEKILKKSPQLDFEVIDSNISSDDEVESDE